MKFFFLFALENYCQNPAPPPEGGTYSWNSTIYSNQTPYQHEVTYSCEEGRLFQDKDDSGNYYTVHKKVCQWDKTRHPNTNVKNILFV